MCSEVKQFENIMFNTEGWVLCCIRHRIYTLWESLGQVCFPRSDFLQHSPGFFVENVSLVVTLHLLFGLWLCYWKEFAICKHDLQIHYNFILDLYQSSTLKKGNKKIIKLYICYLDYWERYYNWEVPEFIESTFSFFINWISIGKMNEEKYCISLNCFSYSFFI